MNSFLIFLAVALAAQQAPTSLAVPFYPFPPSPLVDLNGNQYQATYQTALGGKGIRQNANSQQSGSQNSYGFGPFPDYGYYPDFGYYPGYGSNPAAYLNGDQTQITNQIAQGDGPIGQSSSSGQFGSQNADNSGFGFGGFPGNVGANQLDANQLQLTSQYAVGGNAPIEQNSDSSQYGNQGVYNGFPFYRPFPIYYY